jgi:hypothetical protein
LRVGEHRHRERKLAKLARNPHPGIVLNEEDGDILFKHALRGHRLEAAWVSVSVRAV